MNPDREFWASQRVLVTGHSGFKGGWLVLWLRRLGASVCGYSLPPPTDPSLFLVARVGDGIQSVFGDVRDAAELDRVVRAFSPTVVFHLAAQPLVRRSYADPVETYATNVMGTLHLFEAVRRSGKTVRVVVNVTSDKCYENREWPWGYRENEPMGGFDPYSSSKGCAELLTSAYRRSFFERSRIALGSARAGNVIGGGDWAEDRLIPDMIRSFRAGRPVEIRNPGSIRPWQHVLEPVRGYLLLAERLASGDAAAASGWNFGPQDSDARPVRWLADRIVQLWSGDASWRHVPDGGPHEANYLKLDCSRAAAELDWRPRWDLDVALSRTVEWYRSWLDGVDPREISMKQISAYETVYADSVR